MIKIIIIMRWVYSVAGLAQLAHLADLQEYHLICYANIR